jgi:ectoine hydroxylase-related dioxygenase (phytanoyl-CoA dioxygenase family)
VYERDVAEIIERLRRRFQRPGESRRPAPAAPETVMPAPSPAPARRVLDDDKHLVSDLWLDQPDAHERIDQRVQAGELQPDDAARLHQFTDDGYTVMSIDIDDAFVAAFDRDVDAVWESRPYDLAVSPLKGGRTSFRDFPHDREPGYRIPDFHSHAPTARRLYLHPEIFRVVALIFGSEPIAFQSLYFEYGSQQGLHRDPLFVGADPPGNLVASWIALEDIVAESGPLLYAPGSHRMPWFEFEPDCIAMRDKGREHQIAWHRHRDRFVDEMHLDVKPLTCKRGDVFLWHAGLLHGGAPIVDEHRTRKSFVTHYSTRAHYTSRRATMDVRVGATDEWETVGATTTDVIEENGCKGIDNPLRRLHAD